MVDTGWTPPPPGTQFGIDDQWVLIQEKTFTNWINEQLKVSGRSIQNITTDLCDGVCLVALVEALQFRKIGKVYTKAASKFQMLQNVSLALKAVTDDHVKLVNVGSDDVVNGNIKLILGLVWSLIQRYQISGKKTKAPPKKLMTTWFQSVLPELNITNFTSDWNDGIKLHALVERLKPGTSPDWKNLSRHNRLENLRTAMVLAKEHLNIPRVITPEDFANEALDELSSMTYLSYFVRHESPGYYHTLNWVCKQLRTTNITNLTTDWNDGYYLCAIVNSLGGDIPGWPNIDRSKKLENCQKGIDGGKSLGVEPLMTAKEMSDDHVDHLSLMAYISKFQSVTPRKNKDEKLIIRAKLDSLKAGDEATFQLEKADSDVSIDKVAVLVKGPNSDLSCEVRWSAKIASCSFRATAIGEHSLLVLYDGTLIKRCPLTFVVKGDHSKVKLLSKSANIKMGDTYEVQINTAGCGDNEVIMESTSPTGQLRYLTSVMQGDIVSGSLQPKEVGIWVIHLYFGSDEIQGSPLQVRVNDPHKAWMSGPDQSTVGSMVAYKGSGEGELEVNVFCNDTDIPCAIEKADDDVFVLTFTPLSAGDYDVQVQFCQVEIRGSPARLSILDPSLISVTGEGIARGIKGDDATFNVNATDIGGNITVSIDANGNDVKTVLKQIDSDVYEFTYKPLTAGVYNIHVLWNGQEVPDVFNGLFHRASWKGPIRRLDIPGRVSAIVKMGDNFMAIICLCAILVPSEKGSPFTPKITDRSKVHLLDDLTDLKDENDRLALDCDKETVLSYNIGEAGPGNFSAEVLAPKGRLPVNIRNQDRETVQVGFTARHEGDHYIHLYWSQVPLENSPIIAYCPGPVLPIDHTKVVIRGTGHDSARATVPAEFMIDGKQAGPGIPRVWMQGVRNDIDVEMRAMKYDRYKCKYTAPYPGGYLLYIEWSGHQIQGSPFKVNITMKGHSDKVKVEGQGLKGGYVGQELRAIVDTSEAGNGEISSYCHGQRHTTRCDQVEHGNGRYTLRIFPTEACKHTLDVKYDGEHVPGSPFIIPVGEPPDPRKVKVYGPGIESGVIQRYESKFIVETYGAGAGQLSVRIRGPRGAFKVDMKRDREDERTILCRYDPEEPGDYIINVRWSGVHVPGSPFTVHVFDTKEALLRHAQQTRQIELIADYQWKEEI